MDNYIKMCAGLQELQEGWEPKVRNRIYSKRLKKEMTITHIYNEGYYAIDIKGNGFITLLGEVIYKPSLEDLIGMLEEKSQKGKLRPWDLNYIANENYRKIKTKAYRAWTYLDEPCYYGNTPQEALLKLVAYELYGKVWNKDKEGWEEG